MMDFAWPDDLAPYRVAFYLQPTSSRAQSPFTKASKVYQLVAPLWVCRLTFRGLEDGDDAEATSARLDVMIAQLAGGANRVALRDWRRDPSRAARGVGGIGREPVSQAAAKGATSMGWTGALPGQVLFRPGDYVGGDGRVHLVMARCTADATGTAVVSFIPPLVAAVAAGAGTRRPTSLFRLTSDDAGANEAEVGQPADYSLEFVEDAWW